MMIYCRYIRKNLEWWGLRTCLWILYELCVHWRRFHIALPSMYEVRFSKDGNHLLVLCVLSIPFLFLWSL